MLCLDDSDYVYEYVYYYYDEEGGNGTVVDIKPASSLTKLANISLAATDLIGRFIFLTSHSVHLKNKCC